jgi:hypothetical protein
VKVLEQPLLHDARGLQSDLAVFSLATVLLLDFLLFLKLVPRAAQSSDEVAGVAFNDGFQICHFFCDFSASGMIYCSLWSDRKSSSAKSGK